MAISTSVFRESETVTGAKTLDEGDSGVVQNVTSTATITLPATVVGRVYTITNGGDESVTVTVTPAALDKIMGNGYTSVDGKSITNTLGNGDDEITLVGDGVNGWYVQSVHGTWTYQT